MFKIITKYEWIQIKATSYHFILVKQAKIRKLDNLLLLRCRYVQLFRRAIWQYLVKISKQTFCDPESPLYIYIPSKYLSSSIKEHCLRIHVLMFLEALFVLAGRWRLSRCPFPEKKCKTWWMNVLEYQIAINYKQRIYTKQHKDIFKILCLEEESNKIRYIT